MDKLSVFLIILCISTMIFAQEGTKEKGDDVYYVEPKAADDGIAGNKDHHNSTSISDAIAQALSCSESASESTSESNVNISVEDSIQGQPIIPMSLMPRVISKEREESLWNKRSGPSFTGYYLLKELEQRKNDQGISFVDLKVKVSGARIFPFGLFHRYKESKGLIVVDVVNDGFPEGLAEKGYEYVHTIDGHSSSDVDVDACNYRCLEEAARWGAHVVTIEYGLNHIAKSTGVQLGGNGVKSNYEGSLTGGGGVGSTYAYWEGDPLCKVVLYRKLPDETGKVPSIEEQVKDLLKRK